ncbi:response regulator transcription factor [Uliginosibacterium aquaticum]|uniref:Response regulator transcription factor n=1 Tax=Uliginosibacterium aquaticum TaxID=2731212 RepID=A0ABX2ID13_9RHOO|nr:response regulator transcription factor [Uliginosibacterium aquaticum]NSL53593.1 response regulator transcription factor [Uliginosibacterium aquaticum]
MRIALLEDDPTQSLIVTSCLRNAGHEVHEFRLTADLKRFCARESVDLYLLDWIVPDQSGEEFLRWLRSERNDATAAIFLTSRDAEEDVVAGLAAGADDFIIKPLNQRILLSRIEAVMRRAKPRDMHAILELAPYRIDPAQNLISLKGEALELTEKEFALALFMFRNVGRLISRGHMLEAVWGRSPDIPTRTVDTHVSRVRNKLQLRPENGFRVVPTYNFGYRLEQVDTQQAEA